LCAADRHAYRGHYKNGRSSCNSGDDFSTSAKNRSCADEADTGNNLRRNSRVVAGMRASQLVRQKSEHSRAKTDEEIGAQSGCPMLGFALQADEPA